MLNLARLRKPASLMVATTLLSFALPAISLDGWLADVTVRITDTAVRRSMPWLLALLIVVVISRGGLTVRRRTVEVVAILITALVAGAIITIVNEQGIKPLVASPRPNLVAVAESGVLGDQYPDAESIYAVGDKDDRRAVLGGLLPQAAAPPLSDLVRDHWVHETGYSFPSGHTIAATTLATAMLGVGLAWLKGWRRFVIVGLVPAWAVLIAFSRVLLEVHRPIDVVGGAVVGVGFGLIILLAFTRIAGDSEGPRTTRH